MVRILQRILTTTFFMKKFKTWVVSLMTQKPKQKVMWVEVPMTCTSRKHKDDIIMSTIEHLERNIINLNKLV